ncbi:lipoate--protein ligase family protein [Bradyrhizobium sp.]|uniref:lipoate--protein ligase family protein n=1 Tax=Bradyrhizobium sp. TaxID=376 RepID=UPI003C7786F5
MLSDIVSVAASTAAAGRCAATSMIFFDDFKTADLALLRQEQLAEEISCNHPRLLFLWRAPRALIVGRSDTRLPHFANAVDRLVAEGWPVLIRRSGGSACPISEGTLQIALARAVFTATTIDSAYIELANIIRTVLETYGLKVAIRRKSSGFCPGRHDISVNGRKVAGLSQHWRQCNGAFTVTTAATMIVEENPEEIAHILNLFYRIAGSAERCSTFAVGALRQDLPVDATFDAPLMEDLCNRIAQAACGEWRNDPRRISAPHSPLRVACHKTLDPDH